MRHLTQIFSRIYLLYMLFMAAVAFTHNNFLDRFENAWTIIALLILTGLMLIFGIIDLTKKPRSSLVIVATIVALLSSLLAYILEYHLNWLLCDVFSCLSPM